MYTVRRTRKAQIATLCAMGATALLLCLPGGLTGASAHIPKFCAVTSAGSALAASSERAGSKNRVFRGVVLLVNRGKVTPGGWIYARLANFGLDSAGYSRQFGIERRTPSGWEVDPSSPPGPWPKVKGLLRPDGAGRCFAFQVPPEQVPGSYRFSTKVTSVSSGPGKNRRTAEFRVAFK